ARTRTHRRRARPWDRRRGDRLREPHGDDFGVFRRCRGTRRITVAARCRLGGSGPYSLQSFFAYIDAVRRLGRSVVLDGNAVQTRGIEYSLASYLLISGGNDLVSAHGMTRRHWFTGFDVNLCAAMG